MDNMEKNENYEKKSITLNDERGKPLVEPQSLNFLNLENLTPLYKVFTHIQGTNLGANVILECGDFQCAWRNEIEPLNKMARHNMNKIHIKMHELVAAPVISRRLINLPNLNIREYVEHNVFKSFMRNIDFAIFYGNGMDEPLGLLSYYSQQKIKKEPQEKPMEITLEEDGLMGHLLNMEHKMAHVYKKNAFWIMSRKLHNRLQKIFYTNPQEYSSIINRDDINYKIFGRKLYVCDELDNEMNNEQVHCMLMNPCAYTTIEDNQLKVVENNVDIDLKIIFIKYFGGTVTDNKGIIYGILS